MSQRLGARAELVPLRQVCIGKQRNLKKKKKSDYHPQNILEFPFVKLMADVIFIFIFIPASIRLLTDSVG